MEKSVMVVGLDDSEHSFYALEWTLQHFFSTSPENSPFKLAMVHAKPSPLSAVGVVGPGSADVLPYVDMDLRKIAARVLGKAKEICAAKSIDVLYRGVNEQSVRRTASDQARAVLGSVSDYCAHHAYCSVMIVKRPKIKH